MQTPDAAEHDLAYEEALREETEHLKTLEKALTSAVKDLLQRRGELIRRLDQPEHMPRRDRATMQDRSTRLRSPDEHPTEGMVGPLRKIRRAGRLGAGRMG